MTSAERVGGESKFWTGHALTSLGVLSALLLLGCSGSGQGNDGGPSQSQWTKDPNIVHVTYRDDPVDVGAPSFARLWPGSSTFIEDAWYDESNQYLIIDLGEHAYHYCGLPVSVWDSLNDAVSRGSFYATQIKGNFDCRDSSVPTYP